MYVFVEYKQIHQDFKFIAQFLTLNNPYYEAHKSRKVYVCSNIHLYIWKTCPPALIVEFVVLSDFFKFSTSIYTQLCMLHTLKAPTDMPITLYCDLFLSLSASWWSGQLVPLPHSTADILDCYSWSRNPTRLQRARIPHYWMEDRYLIPLFPVFRI